MFGIGQVPNALETLVVINLVSFFQLRVETNCKSLNVGQYCEFLPPYWLKR